MDPAPAAAQTSGAEATTTVIEVNGLLDPVLTTFVEEQLDLADERGGGIVLQLDSGGAVISDDRLEELVEAVAGVDVPVSVWVGQAGAEARGGAARLLEPADVTGMAPGSTLEVTAALAERAEDPGAVVAAGEVVSAETATRLGLVDNDAPIIGEFVLDLPGVETQVIETDEGLRRSIAADIRFAQLDLVDQLFHTVASPAVAYLLLTIGGGLLIFELFTAGVGVAGMVGAGSLVLAGYGLGVLPVRLWALALAALAFLGFAIDVQTGVPRFWTGVGVVAFVVASFTLFEPGFEPSWIATLAGIAGLVLAMVGGMPTMVRTRFSTPTIGRDWMVGETGVASAAIDPEGVVSVRDAPWRARTNRATPVAAGEAVRISAIDGLVLEVEPLEGAARDYRERRG